MGSGVRRVSSTVLHNHLGASNIMQNLLSIQRTKALNLYTDYSWTFAHLRQYSILCPGVGHMDILDGTVLWLTPSKPSITHLSLGQSE